MTKMKDKSQKKKAAMASWAPLGFSSKDISYYITYVFSQPKEEAKGALR